MSEMRRPYGTDVGADPCPDRHVLMAAIARFQTPSLGRSVWQLASTCLSFVALDAAMYASLRISIWLTLALALPAAGLLVRLFIIQHDCGHGSFFRSRRANDVIGVICSVATFTPYGFWRRQHARHHASFNNLDRRDTGLDVYSNCATVVEYRALTASRRLLYRASRHPVVTQLLLPPIAFLVLYRVPFDTPAGWTRDRVSVHLTNLALACVVGALALLFGIVPLVLVQLPMVVVASIVGAWLFSVQHRFEQSQWARQDQWNPVQASLRGSSYLKLPPALQWLTGNIGFHHVHHLAARMPNYRLQECHDAIPELAAVTTLTLRQALLAPCYALWDEERGRMVRFPPRRRVPLIAPRAATLSG